MKLPNTTPIVYPVVLTTNLVVITVPHIERQLLILYSILSNNIQ